MEHSFEIDYHEVSLYPMTITDSERYRQIRNMSSVRKWFQTNDIITETQQTNWFINYLNNKEELMFSVYVDCQFVGGCSLYKICGTSAEYGRLVISPDHQGKGYGKKATEAALIIAKRIGIKSVFLEVLKNNTIAQQLYLKVGFTAVDALYGNKSKKMIYMKKDL